MRINKKIIFLFFTSDTFWRSLYLSLFINQKSKNYDKLKNILKNSILDYTLSLTNSFHDKIVFMQISCTRKA